MRNQNLENKNLVQGKKQKTTIRLLKQKGITEEEFRFFRDKKNAIKRLKELVPRGGIEPPTRGFSIPCSTD